MDVAIETVKTYISIQKWVQPESKSIVLQRFIWLVGTSRLSVSENLLLRPIMTSILISFTFIVFLIATIIINS